MEQKKSEYMRSMSYYLVYYNLPMSRHGVINEIRGMYPDLMSITVALVDNYLTTGMLEHRVYVKFKKGIKVRPKNFMIDAIIPTVQTAKSWHKFFPDIVVDSKRIEKGFMYYDTKIIDRLQHTRYDPAYISVSQDTQQTQENSYGGYPLNPLIPQLNEEPLNNLVTEIH